ncbi:hypothetical protein ABTX35_40390, partial [Streptomyces sp. NPDC096080]|uniref:hypothetical protein n=1 Tax=Streptomyces sp. NPDC096080 TaxID=3156693 RepID=UPI00331A33AA
LKAGMIYGRGDHLIDHLSHTVQTLPVFATVGFREKPIRPIPIEDLTDILEAAVDGRMWRETVAVVGAEQLQLSKAVRRVASVVDRRVIVTRRGRPARRPTCCCGWRSGGPTSPPRSRGCRPT